MSKCVPIILLASERSGTNLLRAMVSSHSKVSAPPPTGLVGNLASRAFYYLTPLNSQHVSEFIDDAITMTQIHFNPWDISINQQEVLKRLSSVSFWQVFKSLYDIYTEDEEKNFWFSKEPNLFNHIYEIKLNMPDAKFIYMVRDGRDVAASMIKGGMHTSHIYEAAHMWSSDQKKCLTALSDPMLSESMLLINYEDLISDANAVMKKVMEFVGLNYESSQLEYYKNKNVINHSNKTEFWKNISKPLDSTNKGKYKNNLSAKQIEIFESIAWDEMRLLGYQLETKIRKKHSSYKIFYFIMSTMIRKKIKNFDMSEEGKRQKQRKLRFKKILSRTFHN